MQQLSAQGFKSSLREQGADPKGLMYVNPCLDKFRRFGLTTSIRKKLAISLKWCSSYIILYILIL